MIIDQKYMRRALQLARCGQQGASPNPMVGAVIVSPTGLIIGEGFHRRCGGPHAEVNAVRSVHNKYGEQARALLRQSTIYVTLEPCSHYGKTPPCAKLIIDKKIPDVIVGCTDSCAKVSGRGIAMLRQAGVNVSVGMLSDECRRLNRRFFTAHEQKRPWITLKWAQSADGYMDHRRTPQSPAARFSTPATSTLVHRLRSLHDGIMVGSGTVLADSPRLDCRHWPGGYPPQRIAMDRTGRLDQAAADIIASAPDIASALDLAYRQGITSILVEGGPTLLKSFISNGVYDEIRIEVTPVRLAQHGCAPAPALSGTNACTTPYLIEKIGENTIYHYHPSELKTYKNTPF